MECTYKVLIVRVCARMPSHFSRVRLSVTPWTVARQAPLSMGFSRQEYWSGLPLPSPGYIYRIMHKLFNITSVYILFYLYIVYP